MAKRRSLENDFRSDQEDIRRALGGSRKRNSDEPDFNKLPPFLQILIMLLIAGVLLWAFIPHEIIYVSIGLIVVVVVVVSVYVYRKRGFEPFINLGKKSIEKYKVMQQNWEKDMEAEEKKEGRVPPLSNKEQARFIRMVGSRCENPNCRNTYPLEVHHIQPRSEGGSNKYRNLIVLCKNCHGIAQKGIWSKELLKEWISRPRRFGY